MPDKLNFRQTMDSMIVAKEAQCELRDPKKIKLGIELGIIDIVGPLSGRTSTPRETSLKYIKQNLAFGFIYQLKPGMTYPNDQEDK
jgi:hypothetical protein